MEKQQWHSDWSPFEQYVLEMRCPGVVIVGSRAEIEELDRRVHQGSEPIRSGELYDLAVFDLATKADYERFQKERKAFGKRINPDTAEVVWEYGQTVDPYGICPDIPDEYYQVGREYFARDPIEREWVAFRDLPRKTLKALWKKS